MLYEVITGFAEDNYEQDQVDERSKFSGHLRKRMIKVKKKIERINGHAHSRLSVTPHEAFYEFGDIYD